MWVRCGQDVREICTSAILAKCGRDPLCGVGSGACERGTDYDMIWYATADTGRASDSRVAIPLLQARSEQGSGLFMAGLTTA